MEVTSLQKVKTADFLTVVSSFLLTFGIIFSFWFFVPAVCLVY